MAAGLINSIWCLAQTDCAEAMDASTVSTIKGTVYRPLDCVEPLRPLPENPKPVFTRCATPVDVDLKAVMAAIKNRMPEPENPFVDRDLVLVGDVRDVFERERARVKISVYILHRLLPQDIQSRISAANLQDCLTRRSANSGFPRPIAEAIWTVFSKIPSRDENILAEEALQPPAFGYSFLPPVNIDLAAQQIRQAMQGKKIRVIDIVNRMDALNISNTSVTRMVHGDKTRATTPRLYAAYVLADLLLGAKLPPIPTIDDRRQMLSGCLDKNQPTPL